MGDHQRRESAFVVEDLEQSVRLSKQILKTTGWSEPLQAHSEAAWQTIKAEDLGSSG